MTTQLQMHDATAVAHFDDSPVLGRMPEGCGRRDAQEQLHGAWTEMTKLGEYRRIEPRAPRGLSRRALTRACSYIAENLGERFTLDDLARQAGVSRFHFARLFRVSTGDSPMAYLLKSRIERAKQMLLQDERPVCEIAAALGFCDQSHLTRTFRRLTGLTPREFARRHAGVEKVSVDD